MADKDNVRTYTWDDPKEILEEAAGKTGLDYLKLIEEKGVSANPFWQTIGVKNFEVLEPGKVRFIALPEDFHSNIIGSVHGGFAASLLDSALATAVHTLIPIAGKMTTIQMNINYVRAKKVGQGEIYCEGEAVHVGKQMATAEAKVIDGEGKIYSHGTATLLILK